MNAKFVMFIVLLLGNIVVDSGICLAAAAAKVAPVVPPRQSREAQMQELFDRQGGLIREMHGVDLEIDVNTAQKYSLEEAKRGADQYVLQAITSDIASVDKRLRELGLQKQHIEREVAMIGRQIDGLLSAPVVTNPVPVAQRPVQATQTGSDIDALVAEHVSPRACDGKLWDEKIDGKTLKSTISYKEILQASKVFAEGRARIIQLGGLCQKRTLHEANNYCGYYAIYNMQCFSQGPVELQERLLDRDLFAATFYSLLQEIKKLRKHAPYDDLDDSEINVLLQSNVTSPYAFITLLSVGGKCMPVDAGSVEAIQRFKAGAPALSVIFNVGGSHAHWVAIHVQRVAGGALEFLVVDSLNALSWTDDTIVRERILPLYSFLTDAA